MQPTPERRDDARCGSYDEDVAIRQAPDTNIPFLNSPKASRAKAKFDAGHPVTVGELTAIGYCSATIRRLLSATGIRPVTSGNGQQRYLPAHVLVALGVIPSAKIGEIYERWQAYTESLMYACADEETTARSD